MSSSLPNHDAKEQKGQIEKRGEKKNQGQIASKTVRLKKVEKKKSI